MCREEKKYQYAITMLRNSNSCLITFFYKNTEAATGRAKAVPEMFRKNVFLKISQTSQENICAGDSF